MLPLKTSLQGISYLVELGAFTIFFASKTQRLDVVILSHHFFHENARIWCFISLSNASAVHICPNYGVIVIFLSSLLIEHGAMCQ